MSNEEDVSLVPQQPPLGILKPDDMRTLENLFEEGFGEEKTFSIGDPSANPPKVGIYFGELIDRGGDVLVEQPGSKPDPVTGEVSMSSLPTYMFYPLNPTTMQPFKQRIDTVIASHQVSSACAKYLALSRAQGGRAQLLIRWNGMIRTRRGNQMNDISVLHRIVDAKVVDVKGENAQS